MIGSGVFSLIGDTATPTSCVIAGITASGPLASWSISGFSIVSSSNGVSSLYGAYIILTGAINFGVCSTAHISTGAGGQVRASGNYSISGGAPSHFSATRLSSIITSSVTITLTGTPAFTTFASTDTLALLQCYATTFSGSATGQRYLVNGNSVINTYGGGASFLPGSTVGSVTNGVYE